jgi:hypothetical protein
VYVSSCYTFSDYQSFDTRQGATIGKGGENCRNELRWTHDLSIFRYAFIEIFFSETSLTIRALSSFGKSNPCKEILKTVNSKVLDLTHQLCMAPSNVQLLCDRKTQGFDSFLQVMLLMIVDGERT